MKTSVYSFYSESKRAFAHVKSNSKEHVVIYAREVMKEEIDILSVSKTQDVNSHQSSIESLYPELFKTR